MRYTIAAAQLGFLKRFGLRPRGTLITVKIFSRSRGAPTSYFS